MSDSLRGWTEAEIRAYFDQAIEDVLNGEGVSVCGGGIRPHHLDNETLHALSDVGRNPTPEQIAAAYEELEHQLDGTHRQRFMGDIEEWCRRNGYTV